MQKVQIHIARIYILTSSYMTINEVVSLKVQDEAFSVRVLKDTAEIIDFGPRYEEVDSDDRVQGASYDGRSEVGLDVGFTIDSFVLESPTPTTAKLKRPESELGGRLDLVSALNEEVTTNLGNVQECEESPFLMEDGDACIDPQVQLVAEASGLGPTPVPIHNRDNIDLPSLVGGLGCSVGQTDNLIQGLALVVPVVVDACSSAVGEDMGNVNLRAWKARVDRGGDSKSIKTS